VLNRIFQKAFQAAKYVRTHTGITAGLVSVSNVAVELALRMFGKLSDTRVLLLGAGDIGLKSGRAFKTRGPKDLLVASRSLERAASAAAELSTNALTLENGLARLAEFDVVVCSTSSPTAIITTGQAAAAVASRQGRPLFLIDAAMPRNVEAGVGELKNVFLYNLDDLAKIAAENRSARQAEIIQCRAILRERADTLWTQLTRAQDPVANAYPVGALACGA
jgi:glutamyl-tRNA reductase